MYCKRSFIIIIKHVRRTSINRNSIFKECLKSSGMFRYLNNFLWDMNVSTLTFIETHVKKCCKSSKSLCSSSVSHRDQSARFSVIRRVKCNEAMHKYQVLVQIWEKGNGYPRNVGASTEQKQWVKMYLWLVHIFPQRKENGQWLAQFLSTFNKHNIVQLRRVSVYSVFLRKSKKT